MSQNLTNNWKYYLCAELQDLNPNSNGNITSVYPTLEEDTPNYDELESKYNEYCQNNSTLFNKLDQFVGDEQSIAPGDYKITRILFVNSNNETHRKEHYMGINVSWNGSTFTEINEIEENSVSNNKINYLPETKFHCLPDGVLFED